MKLIIDIPEDMYKRICEAQSVPDMYGTDVVNAINRIKKGTPLKEDVFTWKEELSKEESEWLIDFITKEGGAE